MLCSFGLATARLTNIVREEVLHNNNITRLYNLTVRDIDYAYPRWAQLRVKTRGLARNLNHDGLGRPTFPDQGHRPSRVGLPEPYQLRNLAR